MPRSGGLDFCSIIDLCFPLVRLTAFPRIADGFPTPVIVKEPLDDASATTVPEPTVVDIFVPEVLTTGICVWVNQMSEIVDGIAGIGDDQQQVAS